MVGTYLCMMMSKLLKNPKLKFNGSKKIIVVGHRSSVIGRAR